MSLISYDRLGSELSRGEQSENSDPERTPLPIALLCQSVAFRNIELNARAEGSHSVISLGYRCADVAEGVHLARSEWQEKCRTSTVAVALTIAARRGERERQLNVR